MNHTAQLINLMEQNADLYEKLAWAANEEKETIERGLLQELHEIVKAKETLAIKIQMVDEARKSLLDKMGEAAGRPPEELTLAELAELPENRGLREKLLNLRERLAGAAGLVSKLNDFNRNLLAKAICSVMDSLTHLNGLTGSAATYSAGRVVKSDPSKGMVLRKAY